MANKKKLVPSRKKNSLFLPLLGLIFLAGALLAGYLLMRTPQDIRQQAAGSCNENPVNVQFRKYTGKETPWIAGNKLKSIKVGDKIDVNCFAKNGAALLSKGKFTVSLNSSDMNRGEKITIPSSAQKSPQEIRGYKLEKPGNYRFFCEQQGNPNCSDGDDIKVTGSAAASPSPSPAATASPTASPGTCTPTSAADFDKNCKVDLLDYDFFLKEFIKSQT